MRNKAERVSISIGEQKIIEWYEQKGWKPFLFQQQAMQAYLSGRSGLINAPTGSGKTLSAWMPCLAEYINNHLTEEGTYKKPQGLQILWITPLRALAKDIRIAMQEVCDDLGLPWTVALRTGDTSTAEKQKQKRKPPECLITTPESLHIMLSQKDASKTFAGLKACIVDEWHELLGSKRGVQVELALSRIRHLKQAKTRIKVWGISATIGNLDEALEVLLGTQYDPIHTEIIRAEIEKNIRVRTVLPEKIEKFPWAGHMGLRMVHLVLPIIEKSKTTLLFTNTRAQTELWYQKLLEVEPSLAGQMAMHHGSIDFAIRGWVEDAIKAGSVKVVVCTSSLDLGVDFAPVETIIQVGSPKGVARFLQRAGRSGHQPGAVSQIYFVPTHSLELLEAAALKEAIRQKYIESRSPVLRAMDVLVQYLVTLAVGEGFNQKELYAEIKSTYAYKDISPEDWSWALHFITTGGESLGAYDEYAKVEQEGDFFFVSSKKVSMRHRLSMGTIVSSPVLRLKFMSGGYIGSLEETFASRLKPGDVFSFAGRNLEFVRLKDLTVYVRNSKRKASTTPSWAGGRMPMSGQLAVLLRQKVQEAAEGNLVGEEMHKLVPLFSVQSRWSLIPKKDELLMEYVKTREGYHIFVYPFEGRQVHEILGAMVAYRISQLQPVTISIAMNDYGFELLSETEIDLEGALESDLFSMQNVLEDIEAGINGTEMAKRKFRDIAAISGLIFQGYPGKNIGSKHLQSSSQVIFDTFRQYDPDNLLVRQAYEEVLDFQVLQSRLLDTLHRINQQKIRLMYPPKPTPFAFPILVDRMRERISSEKLEDRIARMTLELEKYAEKG